jgi:iron complex outermembrane receptor protein
VDEACANAVISSGIPGCATSSDFHHLGATTYNDVQLGWRNALALQGFKLSVGVNNLFDRDPPICLTCSLNGYDAGTYDLPGRFWYVDATYKF